MSSEVSKYGTGERGTFKLDKPEQEGKAKVDHALLKREAVRGSWYWDKNQHELKPFHQEKKIVNAPYVIPDEMAPVEYMGNANREMYTSKRALRKRYKQDGYIETGGERPRPKPPDEEARRREIREDVARAINDCKYGNAPLTEWEKHQCEMERRELEREKKRLGIRWAS